MLLASKESKRAIVRHSMPRHIRELWEQEGREIPSEMLDEIPYLENGVWEVREACGLVEPDAWDDYVIRHCRGEEIEALRSDKRDEAHFSGYFGALPYPYAKLPECWRDAAMSIRLKKLEAEIETETGCGPVPENPHNSPADPRNSTMGRSVAAVGVICAVLGGVAYLILGT